MTYLGARFAFGCAFLLFLLLVLLRLLAFLGLDGFGLVTTEHHRQKAEGTIT